MKKAIRHCPYCKCKLTITQEKTHICPQCQKEYDFLDDGNWLVVGRVVLK